MKRTGSTYFHIISKEKANSGIFVEADASSCWLKKKKKSFKACVVSGEIKQIPEGKTKQTIKLVLNNVLHWLFQSKGEENQLKFGGDFILWPVLLQDDCFYV